MSSTQAVTVKAYGYIIKLSGGNGSVHVSKCQFLNGKAAQVLILLLMSLALYFQVNNQVTNIPVNLLRGKIQVSSKEGKAVLTTDFMRVVFDGNSTTILKLDPYYKGKVYGLCGNFNGDPQDEYPVTTPGSRPVNTTAALTEAYRLFDGDDNCCTGCKQKSDEDDMLADPVSEVVPGGKGQCAVLMDHNGPLSHCHNRVNPDSFYDSCMFDHMHDGGSELALDGAMYSYSLVCEEASDGYNDEVTAGK